MLLTHNQVEKQTNIGKMWFKWTSQSDCTQLLNTHGFIQVVKINTNES